MPARRKQQFVPGFWHVIPLFQPFPRISVSLGWTELWALPNSGVKDSKPPVLGPATPPTRRNPYLKAADMPVGFGASCRIHHPHRTPSNLAHLWYIPCCCKVASFLDNIAVNFCHFARRVVLPWSAETWVSGRTLPYDVDESSYGRPWTSRRLMAAFVSHTLLLFLVPQQKNTRINRQHRVSSERLCLAAIFVVAREQKFSLSPARRRAFGFGWQVARTRRKHTPGNRQTRNCQSPPTHTHTRTTTMLQRFIP